MSSHKLPEIPLSSMEVVLHVPWESISPLSPWGSLTCAVSLSAHSRFTVPTSCPTCLLLSPGCHLPDPGGANLVFYSSAWLQEDCHWNCTPVWKLLIRVGLLPGHTGLSLDHRSQQNNLTLDLKNTPETFARKARSPSLLLLTISI